MSAARGSILIGFGLLALIPLRRIRIRVRSAGPTIGMSSRESNRGEAVSTTEQIDQLTEATDAELYEAALAWANDFRAEYNLPPLAALPKGYAYDTAACVLAEACGQVGDCSTPLPPGSRYGNQYESKYSDAAGMATFSRDGQVVKRPLPAEVVEFIRRFDAGTYPDLIAKPQPFSWDMVVGVVS